jgi:hypothetical protein
MSTPVVYHEPAHQEPALARGSRVNPYPVWSERAATPAELPSARPGQLVEARAAALFASDLSAHGAHTEAEVAAAIRVAIGAHSGLRGCAGEVAAAYGECPETAARRMRWARAVVEDMYGRPPAPSASVTAGTVPQVNPGQVNPGQVNPGQAGPGQVGSGQVNPGQAGPGTGAPARRAGRPSLAEQGYVHGSFGGVPVLVGPGLAAQLKAIRQK